MSKQLTIGDLRQLIKNIDDEHLVWIYNAEFAVYTESVRAHMAHDYPSPSFLDDNRTVSGLLIR